MDYSTAKSGVRYVCYISRTGTDETGYGRYENVRGTCSRSQEIIDLVLFIASEKGHFINGENIMIDGGRNAMERCK